MTASLGKARKCGSDGKPGIPHLGCQHRGSGTLTDKVNAGITGSDCWAISLETPSLRLESKTEGMWERNSLLQLSFSVKATFSSKRSSIKLCTLVAILQPYSLQLCQI